MDERDEWPPGMTRERPKAAVVPIKPVDSKAFPVTWVSDAVLNLETRPLIKGVFEQGAFIVIYGPSGSGKSFFTADIAQHISTGQAWRGRRANRSLVVYVASEAGSSILRRFIGWRENRVGEAAERLPLAILTRGPNLLNAVELERLVEQLGELQVQAGVALGLVVFDTLSRSIPGGDENNAEDMTMAVNAADYLREKLGVSTAFVHHSGKDPSKGARGHSALFAAADVVLGVVDRVATLEKVRDGVAGERFPFRLEPVDLGVDQDGDSVTTCLLEPCDEEGPLKRAEPVGKNQRIVLKELRAMSAGGERSPGTSEIPKGVMMVRFETLAEKAVLKFTGMPAFKARGRITEALSSLQASGFLGVHGELIWLI